MRTYKRALGNALPLSRLLMAVVGMSLLVMGCASSTSIVVHPLISEAGYAQLSCPGGNATFYVEAVTDKRGHSDPADIGFTQTGMLNTRTGLLSDPPPPELLDNSISDALGNCGQLAASRDAAGFVLRIDLTGFQVVEVTGMVSEAITAMVWYEVEVFNGATGEREGHFRTEGKASRKSVLDTTEFAEEVARTALEQSIQMLLGELADYR